MEWNEIKNFFIVFIFLCSSLITIGGAINLLLNWKKQSRVTAHDKKIEDHEKRISDLEKDKKEKDDFTRIMCNSIYALLSHEINGNSKDKLEKAADDLQKFLINK